MPYKVVHPRKGLVFDFKKLTDITLVGFTDIHIGANECDYKKLQEMIDYVKNTKNCYVFLNGDILELIPPGYKISQRGQNLEPEEQHIKALDIFEPIKDKILWLGRGNHDTDRSVNMLGFDVTQVMARELDSVYYTGAGYIKFNLKNKSYIIATSHGSGGGTSAGANEAEFKKFKNLFPEADLYFLGHNHQLEIRPSDSLGFVEGQGEVLRRQWFVRGGSTLRVADYARNKMYGLVRTGGVSMHLGQKEIKCEYI